MFDTLNHAERRAIEMRYLNYSDGDIAKELSLSAATIFKWFTEGGKLQGDYLEYARHINSIREKEALKTIVESDENIGKITTAVIRQFAEQISVDGQRLMLVDEDNKPILDKNGKPKIVVLHKNFKVKDFVEVWKVQRTLDNRSLGAMDVNVKTQEKIDEEINRFKELMEEAFGEDEEEAIDGEVVPDKAALPSPAMPEQPNPAPNVDNNADKSRSSGESNAKTD